MAATMIPGDAAVMNVSAKGASTTSAHSVSRSVISR
jgi:hypothetical protein